MMISPLKLNHGQMLVPSNMMMILAEAQLNLRMSAKTLMKLCTPLSKARLTLLLSSLTGTMKLSYSVELLLLLVSRMFLELDIILNLLGLKPLLSDVVSRYIRIVECTVIN